LANKENLEKTAETSRSGEEAERQAELASKWGDKVLEMAKELDSKQKMLELLTSNDKIMKETIEEKQEEVLPCVCVWCVGMFLAKRSAARMLTSPLNTCPFDSCAAPRRAKARPRRS
jgi:hypothetical protein